LPMSSLAGWLGGVAPDRDVLQRMAEVMSGPGAVVERDSVGDLALVTVQPGAGEAPERIAASGDSRVTVAFAGRLFSEDDGVRRHPARHCLEGYLRDGLDFPLALNGSFAVVVRDSRCGELHLVTDRLHTRPLYYRAGHPFLFASEIKAILEVPGVGRAVNGDRVLELLARKRLFGPVTCYDHIIRAPDASVTTWDGRNVRSSRYWRPASDRTLCRDLSENARRLHLAVAGAVRRACAGAERPGLLLSAGLDSRVVAAASPRPLACVTMHGHVGREVRTARRVASRLGWQHRYQELPASFPLELVAQGSLIADGSDAFYHAQALHLEEWVRDEGVDVLLGGWFLETFFSETDMVQREVSVFGRRRTVPLLVPIDGLDIADWVWESRAGAHLGALRQMTSGERLAEVATDAKRRIRQRVEALGEIPHNRQALATIALVGETSAHPTRTNMTTADRLAPAIVLVCDTELLDLFLEVPREHRLFHRLYSRMLTRVDRRLRCVPYGRTGIPVSNWTWGEFIAAAAYQTASWATERLAQRVRTRPARTKSSWPRADLAVRSQAEWQRHLRRLVEGSRLVDLGVLEGDGLRQLVEDQIAGRRNLWSLVGLWVTVEEWLAHYG
jgi:hypothetical protein